MRQQECPRRSTPAAPAPTTGGAASWLPPSSPPAPGLVRVEGNSATAIGRALDVGAAGVIVPSVNTAEDAAAAVGAAHYPPRGIRSYGPLRSDLRIGPAPAEVDDIVLVLAMIETADGLRTSRRSPPPRVWTVSTSARRTCRSGSVRPTRAILRSRTRSPPRWPGSGQPASSTRSSPESTPPAGRQRPSGWPRASPWPPSPTTSATWSTPRASSSGSRAGPTERPGQESAFSNHTSAYGLSLYRSIRR